MKTSLSPVLFLLATTLAAPAPAQDPVPRHRDEDLRKLIHKIADRLEEVAARQQEQAQHLAALQERLAQVVTGTGSGSAGARDQDLKVAHAAHDRLAQENQELRAALEKAKDRIAHHEARSKDLEASAARIKQEFQDAQRAREKEMHVLIQAQEDRARAEDNSAREKERRRAEAEKELAERAKVVAQATVEAHLAEARKKAAVARDAERAASEEMQKKARSSDYERDIEALKKRVAELTTALEQIQKKVNWESSGR